MKPIKRSIASTLVALLLTSLLVACAGKGVSGSPADYSMASLDGMPAEVQSAPQVVREAYQFAVANPDILTHLPCYCGCGAMGHTSNYSCYVNDAAGQEEISYDTHALGCSICVDITRDAMRMLKEGKELPEIRIFVDETYSRYGPTNLPEIQ